MRSKVCLGVKHTLTNEGEFKGWSPMIPKCTPALGVAFVWELQMFKALVEKEKNTKLGPPDTIRKFLKRKCLKCPRIVHLDLICMSYGQKKGRELNWEFDSRLQIPWKHGLNEVWLKCVIHHWKDIFKGYKIFSSHFQKKNYLKKI
jgi:hypothetical protein